MLTEQTNTDLHNPKICDLTVNANNNSPHITATTTNQPLNEIINDNNNNNSNNCGKNNSLCVKIEKQHAIKNATINVQIPPSNALHQSNFSNGNSSINSNNTTIKNGSNFTIIEDGPKCPHPLFSPVTHKVM